MAFMMPVVKNDWDIYHSQRTRKTSEGAPQDKTGRLRKISESRSEGPGGGYRSLTPAGLSPHRSAPAMRSLSYNRPPSSRASLRHHMESPSKSSGSGSPPQRSAIDKFHNRLVDKLKRALGKGEKNEERSS